MQSFNWADECENPDKGFEWSNIYNNLPVNDSMCDNSYFEKQVVDEKIVEKPDDGFTTVMKKTKSRSFNDNTMFIVCRDCKNTFEFGEDKIDFFKSKGWPDPKSCHPCRNSRKKGIMCPKIGRKKTLNIND